MKRHQTILIFLVFTCLSCSPRTYDFRFFAMGDMPYHLPEDFQRFERLTIALNKEKPAFTVHVGDIKAGNTPCTDDYFLKIRNYFQEFQHPLLFTPGDNEWTDCYRDPAGSFDPNERLEKLREVFYKEGRSLGSSTLTITSQNTYQGYRPFVENAIWEKEGLIFGTLHVVGSNNNLKLDSLASNDEYRERNVANLFWLQEIFKQAESKGSQGVVLFLHASLNYGNEDSNGFRDFTKRLREEALVFEKPILMIYGDHHRFLVEKPLSDDNGKVLKHFTSLMVFGDRDMHAVEIRVNKKDKGLFEIKQFFVEGN